MKHLIIIIALLSSLCLAQQEATLSGIIKTDGDVPEGTRVAIHVVDRDGVWQREVVNASPVAGTFSITTKPLEASELSVMRNGSILLPGLQNEYTINPSEGVNFALARVNMYVDANGNEVFDRTTDAFFIGVPSLENPIGFFTLIYVDKAVTLSGRGVDLNLAPGWNVFTVRFPESSQADTSPPSPDYAVQPSVEDIVMDVFLP
ncbi:MAG: hypothetical protein KC422_07905 [Trueperaceae bacterium]|nr:hypothetical protein [Trueperaceae bacterium]